MVRVRLEVEELVVECKGRERSKELDLLMRPAGASDVEGDPLLSGL